MRKVRTNLYLTERHYDRCVEIKQETGLSIAETIRRALDDYFGMETGKKEKKEEPALIEV